MTTFNAYQYEDLKNRSADQYAATKYDILMQYLAKHEGLSILNAGCGSGELSLRLVAAGHRVVGIDPEPEYIALAKENAAAAGATACSFEVSFIEDYTADEAFDCVIATDVLEHIENDRAALAKMVRMVRPGGLVLLTVPAGPWLFGYHDVTLGHYRRYHRGSLRQLVQEFCHIEKLRYFGFSLIPICYLYSKVLRKHYPVAQSGDSQKRPLTASVLRTMLQVDRLIPMPLGTSLLLKGVVR